ncbi:MAG: hypothetical protein QM784_30525 [Polyangiaceae bacterium]
MAKKRVATVTTARVASPKGPAVRANGIGAVLEGGAALVRAVSVDRAHDVLLEASKHADPQVASQVPQIVLGVEREGTKRVALTAAALVLTTAIAAGAAIALEAIRGSHDDS